MATQVPVVVAERKQYTGAAARILKLLCSGITQTQAAKAVGVNDSYVSQLCAEPDFQAQIAEHIKKDHERAIKIDENYHDIELSLSNKLKELVPFMHEPDKILRTLKFVNESKKKTDASVPTTDQNKESAGPVKLALPVVVIQNFVTNPNNEVVQVEDRNLVTLNSRSIEALVQNRGQTIDASPTPLPAEPKKLQKPNGNGKEDKWNNL